jgi:siderophore synthetase component
MTQIQEDRCPQGKEQDTLTLAESASVERLLNAYLREVQNFDPRNEKLYIELPISPDGDPFILPLQKTDNLLMGEMTFWSAGGQHAYGKKFYSQLNETLVQISNEEVIKLLLDELSYLEKDEIIRIKKKDELIVHVLNSIKRTETYLTNHLENKKNKEGDVYTSVRADLNMNNFLSSEQSLYFGHPFHPTPKSSEGFTKVDMVKYAPELGASFSLHYFAISTDLNIDQWIDPKNIEHEVNHVEQFIPDSVIQLANKKLREKSKRYHLLPCHPWQAAYVKQNEEVNKLLTQGEMVDLGQLGSKVYPTSSVRTVWDPEHNYFYKLPLSIKITNYIRVNTVEQIKRTLDAAKVIAEIKEEVESEKFGILMEYGYRSVSFSSSSKEEVMDLFSVLFRESPKECRKKDTIFVVASLMEVPPGANEPNLFTQIRQNRSLETIDLADWFSQYMKVTLHQILQVFAYTGVSLEAHAQNSLIVLNEGIPEKCYIRDLEGISINRNYAEKRGWVNTIITNDSHVLYDNEEAWSRLKYYFFVNHLSYVVRTLAKHSKQSEYVYWNIVREELENMKKQSNIEALKKYIDDLLEGEFLPAKANLISRFLGQEESPLYVDIPNPIYGSRFK